MGQLGRCQLQSASRSWLLWQLQDGGGGAAERACWKAENVLCPCWNQIPQALPPQGGPCARAGQGVGPPLPRAAPTPAAQHPGIPSLALPGTQLAGPSFLMEVEGAPRLLSPHFLQRDPEMAGPVTQGSHLGLPCPVTEGSVESTKSRGVKADRERGPRGHIPSWAPSLFPTLVVRHPLEVGWG